MNLFVAGLVIGTLFIVIVVAFALIKEVTDVLSGLQIEVEAMRRDLVRFEHTLNVTRAAAEQRVTKVEGQLTKVEQSLELLVMAAS